jgi:hypothetical protein
MPVLNKLTHTSSASRIAEAIAARNSALVAHQDMRRTQPDRSAPAERTCGAPGCTGRWTPPWKNRRRPIFEQEWGCTPRCLAKLVEAAVRREIGDGIREDTSPTHRHRVPLGLVLLAQGWITHPQLQTALDAQRASGRGRIGDWLASSCGLREEQIARGLSAQWSCPVLSLDGFSPAAMALAMPKRFVAEFGLVPIRVAGSRLLYLAFEEQMDAAVALGIEQMSGLKVESGLLGSRAFGAARSGLLSADAVPVTMKLVRDRDELTAAIVDDLGKRQPISARLVRVHQYYWLRLWLESGAIPEAGTLPTSAEDVHDLLYLVGTKDDQD